MGRKRDLSRDEWAETGKQMKQSRDLLWDVVKRVQGTTRIGEADKILKVHHRIQKLSLDLESVAASQHPDWNQVASALSGNVETSGKGGG